MSETVTVYGVAQCYECHKITPVMEPFIQEEEEDGGWILKVRVQFDDDEYYRVTHLSESCLARTREGKACKGDVGVQPLEAPMPLRYFNRILHIYRIEKERRRIYGIQKRRRSE